jgi:hypothetical protein
LCILPLSLEAGDSKIFSSLMLTYFFALVFPDEGLTD